MKSIVLNGFVLNGGGKSQVITLNTKTCEVRFNIIDYGRFWTCNTDALMLAVSDCFTITNQMPLTVTVCDSSWDIITSQKPDLDMPPPKCDCGGEKTKTPHSSWCSTKS